MGPGQIIGTVLLLSLAFLAGRALRQAGTEDRVDGTWIAEALRNRRME